MAKNDCSIKEDIKDQCILIYNLNKLLPSFKDLNKRINKQNITFINGQASAFMSTLSRGQNKLIRPLQTITPAELSLIVPTIKLFKASYTKTEPRKYVGQDPIIFSDHNDPKSVDSLLSSGQGRLGNVGITKISISQAGKTPAGTGYYKVKLGIFAESMAAFFQNRPGSVPYVDLISFNTKNKKDDPEKNSKIVSERTGEKYSKSEGYDSLNTELRAVFGWAVPTDRSGVIRKEIKNALKECKMLFRLSLHGHSINFNQDGTVQIEIEYHAALESLLNSFRADLFHDPQLINAKVEELMKPENSERLKGAQDQAKERAKKSGVTDEDQLNKIGEDAKTKEANRLSKNEITAEQISRIYKILEDKGAFHYMTPQSIKLFVEAVCEEPENRELKNVLDLIAPRRTSKLTEGAGNYLNAAGNLKAINLQKEKSQEKAKDEDGEKDTPEKQKSVKVTQITRTIPYVFLADIINAATELIQSHNKVPTLIYNYRVLIGPLEFINRISGERETINLGQIPISVHDFNHFIFETIVKNDATSMPYLLFIRKLVKELVLVSLGSLCMVPGLNLIKQAAFKSEVETSMITTTPPGNRDPFRGVPNNVVDIAEFGNRFSGTARLASKYNSQTLASSGDTFDYLIIHASYLPTSYRDGDKFKDEKDGIYHYHLGQDKGMVKEINFSRMNMPSRKLYLMRNEVAPIDQLIERYNARVSLFGMPTLIPGQLIHINPSIAALGDSRNPNSYGSRLGLCGYYYVTKVDHEIDGVSNTFSTNLECAGMGPILGSKKPITKISEQDIEAANQASSPSSSGKTDTKGDNSADTSELYGSQATAINDAFALADSLSSTESPVSTRFSTGDTILEPSEVSDEFLRSLRDAPPYPPRWPNVCENHLYGAKLAAGILSHLNAIDGPPSNAEDIYQQPPANFDFYKILPGLENMIFESKFESKEINSSSDATSFVSEFDYPFVATSKENGNGANIYNEEDLVSLIGSVENPNTVALQPGYYFQAAIPKDKAPLKIKYRSNRERAIVSFKFKVMRDAEELRKLREEQASSNRELPPDIDVVLKTYVFSCLRDPGLGWLVYDFYEKAPSSLSIPLDASGWIGAAGILTTMTLSVVPIMQIGAVSSASSRSSSNNQEDR